MMENKVSLLLISALVSSVALLGACTNEKPTALLKSEGPAASATATKAATSTSDVCSPEQIAAFDRVDPEAIDLERETLPRGLYLATVSAMLIERAQGGRILLHETSGGKGEVICAEHMEKFGDDFEFSLSGLVKFQTNEKALGSGFVSRQFYVYQDKNGYGAVLSNPRLASVAAKQETDLKQLLKGGGQIVRVGEKSYLLKYLREREGVRARLLISLDLVPQY